MDQNTSEHRSPSLVVDFEELLRLLAADLIEASGLAVMKSENAEAALQLMESRPDIRLLPLRRRDGRKDAATAG